MTNLTDLSIVTDGLPFNPQSRVELILQNGSRIEIDTPLSVEDFVSIWETKKNKIKIITGKDSFALIKKRRVDFYHITKK